MNEERMTKDEANDAVEKLTDAAVRLTRLALELQLCAGAMAGSFKRPPHVALVVILLCMDDTIEAIDQAASSLGLSEGEL